MYRHAHPYLQFRTRLAHHALLHVVASLKSSAEIIVFGFGPVLLGLFACLALPGLIAPTLAWPQALALIAAQVLVAALPALLLRKRLHPADVLQWSRPLPIAPALRWQADAAVAAMLMAPLTIVYAISTAIWLYQWPDWLRPVAAASVGLTVLSLLLAWARPRCCWRNARACRPPPVRDAARRPPPAMRRARCVRSACTCGINSSGCRSGAPTTPSACSRACCCWARWPASRRGAGIRRRCRRRCGVLCRACC